MLNTRLFRLLQTSLRPLLLISIVSLLFSTEIPYSNLDDMEAAAMERRRLALEQIDNAKFSWYHVR